MTAVAVVPSIKELFGRLVALFGQIKHDNQRWVFSASARSLPPPPLLGRLPAIAGARVH